MKIWKILSYVVSALTVVTIMYGAFRYVFDRESKVDDTYEVSSKTYEEMQGMKRDIKEIEQKYERQTEELLDIGQRQDSICETMNSISLSQSRMTGQWIDYLSQDEDISKGELLEKMEELLFEIKKNGYTSESDQSMIP